MAEVVPMPKLGFDMTEGTLVRKVKQVGEAVAKGEILAEIETDKATIEVEAYLGGVVKGWLVDEGKPVPVGSPMVVIAEPGEEVDLEKLAGPAAKPKAEAPRAAEAEAPPADPTPAPAAPPAAGRVLASPVARKMAEGAGVDLRAITGTGPNGRVVKRDVEAFVQARPAAGAAPAPSAQDVEVPLTKLRAIIARRMAESAQAVPAIYLTIEADMGDAMALRKQINALVADERKVSVNDLVIKAAALALRQYPNLNASFGGDRVVRRGRVNIGVAVAVENGLLTVVVKDADQKSLAQIAADVKPMIVRARDGKVQTADIEGSTFTVSNLGMYDIEHFTAIVNQPEAAILAVGAVREVPVVKDGALAAGLRMKMTCAADHRVTDGAEVAQFLQAIAQALEEPLRLLV